MPDRKFEKGDLVRLIDDGRRRATIATWYFGQTFRVQYYADPLQVALENVKENATFRWPILFEWDLELAPPEGGHNDQA